MIPTETITEDRKEQSIKTWQRAFTVSLGTEKKYRSRLNDLQTWDKAGSDYEREAKIEALKRLLKY